MKISALTQLNTVSRDINIPVAIGGQTLRVTLGQLLDVLSASIVSFRGMFESGLSVPIAPGSTVMPTYIVFDTSANKFYAAYDCTFDDKGNISSVAAYYQEWDGREMYYGVSDTIRVDCLFLSENGGLYKFNGKELISAGLTDEQAQQLRLNTPIRVESEEEMERMIADGKTVEGQLYYIPEE